jgi:hypothetical protein
MAITLAGERLTEAHRRTQLAIRATVLRQLLQVWPMLDPVRLDETSPAFLAAATRLVIGGRQLSERASMIYLQQFGLAEGVRGVAPIVVPPMTSATTAAIRTSLTVTGPVSIKKATARGLLVSMAKERALSTVSAAVARHVVDGGREVTLSTVREWPATRGWARVASAKACAFCVMLAGRGGVYTEKSAGFESHDGCGCIAEPVFRGGDYKFPPGTADYFAYWDTAVRGEFATEYSKNNPDWAEKLRNERSADKRTSLLVNGPLRAFLEQERAS